MGEGGELIFKILVSSSGETVELISIALSSGLLERGKDSKCKKNGNQDIQ
ncbi:MAG: hypothetical protein ABDK78_04390 [Atribacterota bacterium]